jgi:formylmethanofuran dehydrogenase subunit B
MSDVERITTINQNKRRVREVDAEEAREAAKAARHNAYSAVLYGLTGSAITACAVYAALGEALGTIIMLGCAAAFVAAAIALRSEK